MFIDRVRSLFGSRQDIEPASREPTPPEKKLTPEDKITIIREEIPKHADQVLELVSRIEGDQLHIPNPPTVISVFRAVEEDVEQFRVVSERARRFEQDEEFQKRFSGHTLPDQMVLGLGIALRVDTDEKLQRLFRLADGISYSQDWLYEEDPERKLAYDTGALLFALGDTHP